MTLLVIQMTLVKRLIPLLLACVVIVTVVEMIRRRKLREEYAMLWLAASAVLLVFAVAPTLVFKLQAALGVNYLTIVVLSCFLFLAMIVMHFAMVISRQAEEIRQLAQRTAILEHEVDKARAGPAQGPAAQAPGAPGAAPAADGEHD